MEFSGGRQPLFGGMVLRHTAAAQSSVGSYRRALRCRNPNLIQSKAQQPIKKVNVESIYSTVQDDVSKQEGCTIYMQEGIRQAKPLACICITYRLDELAACRYLHAPKTTTTMQEDNHVYKQIDR